MLLRRLILTVCLPLAACAKPDAESDPQPAAGNPQPAVTNPPPFDLAKIDQSRQMGPTTAKVWFIMGSDFQCPYCKSFHDETWPRIEREYVKTGKLRVAFMHHPMEFHPRAIPAAEVAMCAGAQDRFWQMHDSLFVNQEKWVKAPDPQPVFEAFAQSLGLEMSAWRNCVSSHATRAMVEQDFMRTSQVGIKGTPSFVIADSLAIVGAAPFGDFKKALDDALAKAGR